LKTANFEPTLQNIEDYNGNESKEKRRTIILVIISLLVIGVVYTVTAQYFMSANDQIVDAPDLVKRF